LFSVIEPNPEPYVGTQFSFINVKLITSFQWLLCSAEEDREEMTVEDGKREEDCLFLNSMKCG
jgi:hypothetical protein